MAVNQGRDDRTLTILALNKFHHATGGADTFFRKLNEALRARGHRVIEFSTRHPANWPADPEAVFVWGLEAGAAENATIADLGRAFLNGIWNRESARALATLLANVRPDVVHVHNLFYQLSHSVVSVTHRVGIPVVLTLHDYHPVCANNYLYTHGRLCEDCKQGIHKILANRCFHDRLAPSVMAFVSMALRSRPGAYLDCVAHVMSPSRFLLDKIREFGVRLPPASVLPVFYELPPAAQLSPPGGDIVYLGQLLPQKGVGDLLTLAARTQYPVVFAGAGPLRHAVEEAARRSSNVRYEGFVTGPDLERVIGGARCVVVPSLWYENAPAVILDAYARGRPVIASRIGGIPEIVEHDVTGLLVQPGDTNELTAAVNRLGADLPSALAMGSNGRRRLAEHHSVSAYLDATEHIYRQVLA